MNSPTLYWSILEILINVLDSFLILRLITSSLSMKHQSRWVWVVSTLILSLVCSLANRFCSSIFQMLLALTVSLLAFTLLFTEGSLSTKIFWTAFTQILFFGNDMIHSTLVLKMLRDVPNNVIYEPGAIRLYLMVITRVTLITVIIGLRKKHLLFSASKKQNLVLLLCPILSWFSLLLLTNLFAKSRIYDSYVIISTVLICSINAVYVYLFINLKKQDNTINENNLIIQRLDADRRHYDSVKLYNTYLSEWKHDINKHLQAILGLVKNDKTSQAVDYITKIEKDLFSTPQPVNTKNPLFDSLVGSYCGKATSQGIQVSLELMVPPLDFVEETDLCSIVGNIWENAIEGCLRSTCEPKHILFRTTISHNHFMMEMSNSCSETTDKETSKSEPGHGLGLKIISRLLEKNDGFYSIRTSEDSYTIYIALPYKSESYDNIDPLNIFFWKNY